MTLQNTGSLAGRMLVAMPQMQDPRFARTVIFLCAHTAEGAMGLVVNRLLDQLSFPDLLEQLGLETTPRCEGIHVHFGGPVESGRGFVLHTPDYMQDSTLLVDEQVALTATVDVLRAIADGNGPRRSMLALGYAGWGAGQLDSEIRENAWLIAPSDDELLFGEDLASKWEMAVARIGIDFGMLSPDAGHA